MVHRVLAALIVAIAVLSLPLVALAAPTARLVYVRNVGAESCPDELAIRAAVAARLGYDPFLPVAKATMLAEISKEAKGYRARIKLVDEDNAVRGSRELAHDGERCADMIDAMALTMSIAIDPDSLMGPKAKPIVATKAEDLGSPTDADDKAMAPATKHVDAPPAKPPVERVTSPSGSALRLEIGAGPAVWVGAAPAAAASGSLFVRARWPRVSLSLEGRGDFPASRAFDYGTVETRVLFATLAPCVHCASVIAACATASGGSIRATSRGVSSPRNDSAWHAAVGPRVEAAAPLSEWVSVWLHLDALYTLTPQTLQVNGVDVQTLHGSPSASARVPWCDFSERFF